MATKEKLTDLQQQQIMLMEHEKVLRDCLKMIREEKNKLQIERLQLESMIDEVKLKKCKEKPRAKFQPQSVSLTADVNDQELQLNVTDTLHSMFMGSFCGNESGNNAEDDSDEQDDPGQDLLANVFDLIDF